MPEGPSIVIAKEKTDFLAGKTVTEVHGNAKIDLKRIAGHKIISFKTWGKHFLICFKDFTIRVHFMMFGTYLINERKKTPLRLGLIMGHNELNLYTCSVAMIEGDVNDHYNWEEDIMSDQWTTSKTLKRIQKLTKKLVAIDALLDQHLFSGSGNIIKNEVLYRTKIHPLSELTALPAKKLKELIEETRNYAFDFLKWKKAFTLSKHWEAYEQKQCRRCDIPLKKEHLGAGKRVTYFCDNCQKKYKDTP